MPIPVRPEPSLNVKGSGAGDEPEPSSEGACLFYERKGLAREGEWLEVPTTQGNQKKALGRTGGGKQRGPTWPPPPVHTVSGLHTHTTRFYGAQGTRHRRAGARCRKGARGLRGARTASPSPPRARARTHAAPRGSCSCASPPLHVPTRDAALAGTRAESRWPR